MTERGLREKAAEPPGRNQILLAAAVIALLAVGFWWTVRWMVVRWDQTNSYYSHGWLVLPISAFLVYVRRRDFLSCRPVPSAWGLALLVPALLLHVAATAWQVGFLSGFALLGALGGLVLSFFGWRVLRAALFPLVFLAFMVPLPVVLVDMVSFRLKLLAARIVTDVVGTFGLAAVRDGSYIRIPSGTIIVDDVCSGLKYLIALTAFGALYAYISPVRRFRKAILFGCAIPVSFVANLVRVLLMVLVAFAWGVQATERWYFHDFFGFFLFVVAFVFLFGVESVLLGKMRASRWSGDGDDGDGEGPRRSLRLPRLRGVPAVALGALLVAALFSGYLAWPRPTADLSDVFGRIPRTLHGWEGTDSTLSDREYQVLGTRNVLARLYENHGGGRPPVQVVVVVARQIRRRSHPPEQCLTGSGWSLKTLQDRTLRISTDEGRRRLQVRELVLGRGDRVRAAWYFYKSGPDLNTSYWLHQAGVAMRKLWQPDAADVLVRFDVIVPGDRLAEGRAAMRDLISCALPHLLHSLP